METSLYLAKFIGIVMAMMGVYILLFPNKLRVVATEFLDSQALMFLGGMMALMVGVPILLAHNIWVMAWPVIITLFGWLAIVAGILRLTMSEGLRQWGIQTVQSRASMLFAGMIMLAIGAVLVGKGFGWT